MITYTTIKEFHKKIKIKCLCGEIFIVNRMFNFKILFKDLENVSIRGVSVYKGDLINLKKTIIVNI